MGLQIINTGSYANDGTGDPLQTSFNKVNANFVNLTTPSASGINGNVDLYANSITVVGSVIGNVTGNITGNLTGTASTATIATTATYATTAGSVSGTGNVNIGNVIATGNITAGNLTISNTIAITSGPFLFSSAIVSAAGTNQGTATAVNQDNIFVTGGTGGILLPTATQGREISITNNTAVSINVYPAAGHAIENSAANIPILIPPYSTLGLIAKSGNNWWAIQPVYNTGTNMNITQSANGAVTWALANSVSISGAFTARGNTSVGYQIANLSVSTSITLYSNVRTVIVDSTNGATVASATLTFPANTTVSNGQMLTVTPNCAVTTLTATAGSGTVINNAPTTLAVGTSYSWVLYQTAPGGALWVRI